jgi:fermentation-respiration switch protein FrsA (DUF1100 family)
MRAPALLIASLLLGGCTSMFFQPHGHQVLTPTRFGLSFEEIRIPAADGVALNAWFLPSRGPAAATVLHLHGNAENISTHFTNVAWMPAAGFNVLALDYRGYGASEGRPTLAGVQLDIDAAMRALLARPDVDPGRIVVLGQSLGGALALHYAAHGSHRTRIRALVVDSAFSDYRGITREKLASFFLTWPLQWLPWLTVDNDYSPAAAIGKLAPLPLVLIHGGRDVVVPVAHARRLYALAREPKELWIEPEAGHIQALDDEAVRRRLAAFLRRIATGT